MVASRKNGKPSNGRRNGKQPGPEKKYTPNDPKTGRFRKGCKAGPGPRIGSRNGVRLLLDRFDLAVQVAVERGDFELAEQLFYTKGGGTGLLAMLREFKRLGILDALLADAAVPETVKVEIVIGKDRMVKPPPGCDPYPVEDRFSEHSESDEG